MTAFGKSFPTSLNHIKARVFYGFYTAVTSLSDGLVEGITEFLPISSTGHLIITAELLGFWTKEKRDVFEVAIQLGAILSVCYEYRERLFTVIQGLLQNKPEAWRFSINVAIAFIPAAILGFLFLHRFIE